MKNYLRVTSTILLGLVLGACASTPNHTLAVQKPNNQYEVTGIGKTNLIAKNNAINAANQTCDSKAAPVVVDEKTTYQGVLKDLVDEETGKMVQAASGVIGIFTGKSTDLSRDDDYQTTLTFYCKAQ